MCHKYVKNLFLKLLQVLELLHADLIRPTFTDGVYSIKFGRMKQYHKFAHEVLEHSPNLRIHLNKRRIPRDNFMTTTKHEGLRILTFHKCERLINMNLKYVPNLKSLTFSACPNLAKVDGWEELTNLGRLDVTYCPKLSPTTKNLKALKYFNMSFKKLDGLGSMISEENTEFDTRTMTKMGQYFNLTNLRTLENFSVLHCSGLRIVEDSFGSLSQLTECSFRGCHSLHELPDVSNLINLKTLDIQDTKIETIPGLEKLNNLERLLCRHSQVKSLPDLSHMQKLKVGQPDNIFKGKISSQKPSSSQETFPIVVDDDTCTDWSDDGLAIQPPPNPIRVTPIQSRSPSPERATILGPPPPAAHVFADAPVPHVTPATPMESPRGEEDMAAEFRKERFASYLRAASVARGSVQMDIPKPPLRPPIQPPGLFYLMSSGLLAFDLEGGKYEDFETEVQQWKDDPTFIDKLFAAFGRFCNPKHQVTTICLYRA
jgi:hypothetical protein